MSSLRRESRWRTWLPIVVYAISSLAFVIAIACYRHQLFAALDRLAHYLRFDSQYIDGRVLLGLLIFLTTIPPLPLYSTLIVLSGYTFDWLMGAIISYIAALSGAFLVFIISRSFLHESISSWLHSTTTLKRAVFAIEKRPKLLFLIRLAPYPYNVMNSLLAASNISLKTYLLCTALSLFKVVIHTSVGASIHSFRDYHNQQQGNVVAKTWTVIGIILCIGILVYLSVVARRAVDEELLDDEGDEEERTVFLAPDDDHHNHLMVESPFSPSRSGPSISIV